MANNEQLKPTFSNIANAIREKTGDTALMTPAEMPDKIRSISSGGGNDWKEITIDRFKELIKTETPTPPQYIVSFSCSIYGLIKDREFLQQYKNSCSHQDFSVLSGGTSSIRFYTFKFTGGNYYLYVYQINFSSTGSITVEHNTFTLDQLQFGKILYKPLY